MELFSVGIDDRFQESALAVETWPRWYALTWVFLKAAHSCEARVEPLLLLSRFMQSMINLWDSFSITSKDFVCLNWYHTRLAYSPVE